MRAESRISDVKTKCEEILGMEKNDDSMTDTKDKDQRSNLRTSNVFEGKKKELEQKLKSNEITFLSLKKNSKEHGLKTSEYSQAKAVKRIH